MIKVQFQEHLNALQSWGHSWGMWFDARKCNIMTTTNKENLLSKFHQLINTILEQIDCASCLGILIHKSLKFLEHIGTNATMCSQRLGVLCRNLKQCPKELRKTAYLSLLYALPRVQCRDMGSTPGERQKRSRKDPEQSHPLDIHHPPMEPTNVSKFC